jgi:prevent-host-death family protein
MHTLHVSKDIVPLGKFKAHASAVLKALRSAHRPIVITQNGTPAAVLLSPQEFDQLNEQARFISAVQEGLRDADEGRVISDAELGKLLDAPS